LPEVSIRVVVADDHGVVRAGLSAILTAAGCDVVGEAADGRAALEILRVHRPDVALLDAALPGLSGLEVARRVARRLPEVRVVIVSMFDEPAWKAEAARVGASAYVLKEASPEELVDAVHAAARGERSLARPLGSPLPLTARERQVVQLVAEGKRLGEIAQFLSRSPATVRAHKASAMRKLDAGSTPALVREALRLRLVCVPNLREARGG